jgi:dipeptidyl aminopeptidase/acylaminoacyl peptidase
MWVRRDAESPWEVLQEWGPEETFGGPVGFSPENDAVRLLSSSGANTVRLIEVDIETGETRVLAEDPQYDVAGLLWHPRQPILQAAAFRRARLEWEIFDDSVKPDFETLQAVRDGEINIKGRDSGGDTWLVAYSTEGPDYYYVYDRASRTTSFLFSDRPDLEAYRLANVEPISFEARDGMVLYGYLTMPGGMKGSAPTVLLVHGGPWSRDTSRFDSLVQLLANRGYAVLQINYRGSTGYGNDYQNAGDREWGGKMQDDLVDGKRWAVSKGYAHPDKVAIMGESYGGYATLVGLTFTPEEFTCGIAVSGPSDLVTFLDARNTLGGPLRPLYDRRVGNPSTEADFLRSRSPLFQAHRIRAPLLVAHGAKDGTVKPEESDQIVERMRQNNLPVEYLVFPDERHNIDYWKAESRVRLMAAAERFLADCLGGRYEALSLSR